MTTRYCGPGGNNANDGLSWANRKLTLNGVEDSPVAAGDVCYIAPGTYRETLTVDVSGSGGSPITYIGDYSGDNTDGVGGVVRITGSDNDQTATRNNCIVASNKNYRTFAGFVMDTWNANQFGLSVTDGTNWIIEKCHFTGGDDCIGIQGGSQNSTTIRRCYFLTGGNTGNCIQFTHSSVVNDTTHVVENCIIQPGGVNSIGIASTRIGGIAVRNCTIVSGFVGVSFTTLDTGQSGTVNNCLLSHLSTALNAGATGMLVENYNNLYRNSTDRTNVSTGANSIARPPLFDTRWFFEAVGAIKAVTPFDLASYSTLVELNSGTGAPSADLRGTTVQGTYREWGPLEYDAALDIEAGSGGGMGGIFGSIVR